MTKKELPEKCNESCVKMFTFLKMLYEEDVDFKIVIDLLSDGKYDGTSNTHVTLNKYLNAMKIFGIKIKKINKKYKMLNSPYKIKLDANDLKSIKLLQQAWEILPKGKTKTEFESFLKALEIRYDETTQSLLQISDNTQNLDLDFYHSELVEQLKKCEQYCQDKQKLEIIFTSENGEELNLLCSPLERTYKKRKNYLKVLGSNGSSIYEIPLENIKSIKQLPCASSAHSIPTTVVYRIKNRLARNYKLREWENLNTIEDDGSHIIVNKNEDLTLLLHRIMRYGTECEIISPKFLREEMIDLINKTIENYQ